VRKDLRWFASTDWKADPQDIADPKINNPSYNKRLQLAERGFITFSPQNPYIEPG